MQILENINTIEDNIATTTPEPVFTDIPQKEESDAHKKIPEEDDCYDDDVTEEKPLNHHDKKISKNHQHNLTDATTSSQSDLITEKTHKAKCKHKSHHHRQHKNQNQQKIDEDKKRSINSVDQISDMFLKNEMTAKSQKELNAEVNYEIGRQ